jgi:hypothetical protein
MATRTSARLRSREPNPGSTRDRTPETPAVGAITEASGTHTEATEGNEKRVDLGRQTDQGTGASPSQEPMRTLDSYTQAELLAMSEEELLRYEQRVIEAEEDLRRRAKIEALLARARAVTTPMPIRGSRPQEVVASDAGPVQTGGRSLRPTRQVDANSAGPAQTGGRLFEAGNQAGDTVLESVSIEAESTPKQTKPVKPPRFDVEKKYETKGLKAKKAFESKLKYHFKQNAWYYEAGNSDQRKILTAVNAFGEDMLDRWSQLEEDGADVDAMTWREFDEFLLRQIKAPELLRDDANRTYQSIFQRTNQKVTEFSRVLRNWEQQLDVTYNDAQRKSHLKGRILESVRIKAQESGKAEPEGYEAYVTHLQSIEDKMPERQKELRSLHPSSNEKSEKPTTWNSGFTNRGRSVSRGRRGTSRGRGDHRYKPYDHDSKRANDEKPSLQDKALPICNHCGKVGHEEPTCWIKHPEKRPKRNENPR